MTETAKAVTAMAFVLDASVVLAWLLPDERSAVAQRLLLRSVQDRPRAPSLLLVEVANALLQVERRTRLGRATRLELLDAFTALPIALEPLPRAGRGSFSRPRRTASRRR